MKKINIFILLFINIALILNGAQAQEKPKHKHKIKSVYFAWGYNDEWYTHSTIHIQQGALGNFYKLMDVEGRDHRGWNEGPGVLHEELTIPQYNYRLGFYINEKQDLALELNFDHTKYLLFDNQTIELKGTLHNRPVDSNIVFSQANGDYYYLNNGANFFLFNLVKRKSFYKSKDNNLHLDFIGKAGIGPLVPHVQNRLFGVANNPHFQFGGWNTGVEMGIKATCYRRVYLELTQKFDYARYSNLQIYDGTARQAFGTYELILTLGVILPTSKHDPEYMHIKGGN